MSTTLAELAADEAAFEEYLATLKNDPEDAEQMDNYEWNRREHNLLLGERDWPADGVRLTNRSSVRAVRLA